MSKSTVKIGSLVRLTKRAGNRKQYEDLVSVARYGLTTKEWGCQLDYYWVVWFDKDGSYLIESMVRKVDLKLYKKSLNKTKNTIV